MGLSVDMLVLLPLQERRVADRRHYSGDWGSGQAGVGKGEKRRPDGSGFGPAEGQFPAYEGHGHLQTLIESHQVAVEATGDASLAAL